MWRRVTGGLRRRSAKRWGLIWENSTCKNGQRGEAFLLAYLFHWSEWPVGFQGVSAGFGALIKQWVWRSNLRRKNHCNPLEMGEMQWGGRSWWSAADLGLRLSDWIWRTSGQGEDLMVIYLHPGQSVLWVLKEYLLELRTGIKQSFGYGREVRMRRSVWSTGDEDMC